MTTFTIGEVSRQTGLSIDTLRYYERIELVINIGRNQSGHRCYTVDDTKWLNLLVCLRTTGMPIEHMLHFAQLVRVGDQSKPQRIDLLQQHRQNVLAKIELMHEKLKVVDGKIAKYTTQVTQQ